MKTSKLVVIGALSLVIACLKDSPRSPLGPTALITDAVHNGGTPGFYFLPPLVPQPTIAELFNAFLQPLVQICPLDATGQVDAARCATSPIQFTRTSGAGSELIRANAVDEHYIVNWHTDLFGVTAGDQYRIEVFAGFATGASGGLVGVSPLGVADIEIAASGKAAKNITGGSEGDVVGLVDGRTLPIKFFAGIGALRQCDQSAVTCVEAIVPPSGGLVVAVNADGEPEAFADFPANWNDRPALVSLEEIPEDGDPYTGPLGVALPGVRQWPLFFEFLALELVNGELVPAGQFAQRVRIGVCNVESPLGTPLHPEDRARLSLGIGGAGKFRTLPLADASDILGMCDGISVALHDGTESGGWLEAAALAALETLGPTPLHATTTAAAVDGGMGGSTDSFESPVGAVEGKPDLDLIELGSSTQMPVVGEMVTFVAVITNAGDLHAGRTFARIDVSGQPSGELVSCPQTSEPLTASLAPGQECIVSRVVTFTAPGEYTATATADASGDLASEYDETNNTASFSFTVGEAQPDLAITNIAVAPAAATFADPITYDVTVRNDGTAPSPATTVTVDGPAAVSGETGAVALPVPALDPGAETTVRALVGPRVGGSAIVTAAADPDNTVAESDEANNQLTSAAFSVEPRLTFETLGDGAPAGDPPVLLTTAYRLQGLTFSYGDGLVAGGACLAVSGAHEPAAESGNHSVNGAAGECGLGSGVLAIALSGGPTAVTFRLRSDTAYVPAVAALGPTGLPATVQRSAATTYTTGSGTTFREELVTITSSAGVASVTVGMVGFPVLLDNLAQAFTSMQ